MIKIFAHSWLPGCVCTKIYRNCARKIMFFVHFSVNKFKFCSQKNTRIAFGGIEIVLLKPNRWRKFSIVKTDSFLFRWNFINIFVNEKNKNSYIWYKIIAIPLMFRCSTKWFNLLLFDFSEWNKITNWFPVSFASVFRICAKELSIASNGSESSSLNSLKIAEKIKPKKMKKNKTRNMLAEGNLMKDWIL